MEQETLSKGHWWEEKEAEARDTKESGKETKDNADALHES